MERTIPPAENRSSMVVVFVKWRRRSYSKQIAEREREVEDELSRGRGRIRSRADLSVDQQSLRITEEARERWIRVDRGER